MSAGKKRWTDKEKNALLEGLKKHGSNNVQKLKHKLPNKNVNAIKQMIRKYQTIADLGKKEINSPLDIWLRSGIFNEESNTVPEALLFIYLFEKHPPPEETAGFDLKSAYKFLYESATGNSMTTLSNRTIDMLKDLILSVDKDTWPDNECTTTDYLISKLCLTESNKTYHNNRMNLE